MTLHGFIRSPGIGKSHAQGFMKRLFVGRGQEKGSEKRVGKKGPKRGRIKRKQKKGIEKRREADHL